MVKENEALRKTVLDQVERIEHELQTLVIRATMLRKDLEELLGKKT